MADDTKLGSLPLLSNQGGLRKFGNGMNLLQLWANICILVTDEGVVLFDAGFEFNGPRVIQEVSALTDRPIRYIIYGHGHADHAFGSGYILDELARRKQPRPLIVAHEQVPVRFDRYREMLAYHEHINRIQFAIPDQLPAFSKRYTYPDLTYRDSLTFKLGNLTFQLRHARGETDDCTWIWIPETKTACVSDLFVWSCPNLGNPFKVQRFETEWAQALEEIAGCGPELLLPGHGAAIEGRGQIQEACLTTAAALRYMHEQVVSKLNQGQWQEEILQNLDWPKQFADKPWLAPIYGHPTFVVHAILRRYHGWYDGNPSHLFPSHSSQIAAEVLGLAGAPEKVMARAKALHEQGQSQLALHLVDFVIQGKSAPDREALEFKLKVLEAMAEKEPSLIARNILLGGARQIKKQLEPKK